MHLLGKEFLRRFLLHVPRVLPLRVSGQPGVRETALAPLIETPTARNGLINTCGYSYIEIVIVGISLSLL